MMIKSSEEIVIYESPDGGKTVYARKPGETIRHIQSENRQEQKINIRWANLKEAVELAESDLAMNDLLEKVEIYLKLKK